MVQINLPEQPETPQVNPLAPPTPFIPASPPDVLLQALLTTMNASSLPVSDKVFVAKAFVRQVVWAG